MIRSQPPTSSPPAVTKLQQWHAAFAAGNCTLYPAGCCHALCGNDRHRACQMTGSCTPDQQSCTLPMPHAYAVPAGQQPMTVALLALLWQSGTAHAHKQTCTCKHARVRVFTPHIQHLHIAGGKLASQSTPSALAEQPRPAICQRCQKAPASCAER